MVEFGTCIFYFQGMGTVRVRVLGYGSGVRGRKVKSRDCALASDLVKAFLVLLLEPLIIEIHHRKHGNILFRLCFYKKFSHIVGYSAID